MDWFTHIFAAVAIGIALGSRRKVLLAIAFGAMAPDLDALLTPVTLVAPQLWFLDHRTFRLWRRVFRVDISLPMDRTVVLPIFAGVLLHILMDLLTIQGPALFTPFSATRFQLDWFYFVDIAPLAISSPLVVLTLWKLGSPKLRTRVIAVLLVAVLATGAWRGITKTAVESANPGAAIVPTQNPQTWWTWRELANGTIEIRLAEAGRAAALYRATFPLLQVNGSSQGLERARTAAESTIDFTAFMLNAYAVALNATLGPDGYWWLGYFDPVRRAQALYSATENLFSPADLVIVVAPNGTIARVTWP
ncbi:MAG: metal-dependent hydrolase [Methanobacteriota archaeon]|nr:MAG: metal-dependent hydrolase [Euryarchaeota archaeon]